MNIRLAFAVFILAISFSLLEGWNNNITVNLTFYGEENGYQVMIEMNRSLLNGSQNDLSDIRFYYPDCIEKYRFWEKATDQMAVNYWLSWDYDGDGRREIFVHINSNPDGGDSGIIIFQISQNKILGDFSDIVEKVIGGDGISGTSKRNGIISIVDWDNDGVNELGIITSIENSSGYYNPAIAVFKWDGTDFEKIFYKNYSDTDIMSSEGCVGNGTFVLIGQESQPGTYPGFPLKYASCNSTNCTSKLVVSQEPKYPIDTICLNTGFIEIEDVEGNVSIILNHYNLTVSSGILIENVTGFEHLGNNSLFFDYDNDGKKEIILCYGGNKSSGMPGVIFVEFNGTGFKLEKSIEFQNDSLIDFAITPIFLDFDGDGKKEIVCSYKSGDNIVFFDTGENRVIYDKDMIKWKDIKYYDFGWSDYLSLAVLGGDFDGKDKDEIAIVGFGPTNEEGYIIGFEKEGLLPYCIENSIGECKAILEDNLDPIKIWVRFPKTENTTIKIYYNASVTEPYEYSGGKYIFDYYEDFDEINPQTEVCSAGSESSIISGLKCKIDTNITIVDEDGDRILRIAYPDNTTTGRVYWENFFNCSKDAIKILSWQNSSTGGIGYFITDNLSDPKIQYGFMNLQNTSYEWSTYYYDNTTGSEIRENYSSGILGKAVLNFKSAGCTTDLYINGTKYHSKTIPNKDYYLYYIAYKDHRTYYIFKYKDDVNYEYSLSAPIVSQENETTQETILNFTHSIFSNFSLKTPYLLRFYVKFEEPFKILFDYEGKNISILFNNNTIEILNGSDKLLSEDYFKRSGVIEISCLGNLKVNIFGKEYQFSNLYCSGGRVGFLCGYCKIGPLGIVGEIQ